MLAYWQESWTLYYILRKLVGNRRKCKERTEWNTAAFFFWGWEKFG
jgi:hypothetical protein